MEKREFNFLPFMRERGGKQYADVSVEKVKITFILSLRNDSYRPMQQNRDHAISTAAINIAPVNVLLVLNISTALNII